MSGKVLDLPRPLAILLDTEGTISSLPHVTS